MQKVYLAVIGILLAVQVGWADGGNPLTVSSEGWTVTVEGERGTLTVSREGLEQPVVEVAKLGMAM